VVETRLPAALSLVAWLVLGLSFLMVSSIDCRHSEPGAEFAVVIVVGAFVALAAAVVAAFPALVGRDLRQLGWNVALVVLAFYFVQLLAIPLLIWVLAWAWTKLSSAYGVGSPRSLLYLSAVVWFPAAGYVFLSGAFHCGLF
jgi:hypothetical protein